MFPKIFNFIENQNIAFQLLQQLGICDHAITFDEPEENFE